jgi:6-phosphogluconolactonase
MILQSRWKSVLLRHLIKPVAFFFLSSGLAGARIAVATPADNVQTDLVYVGSQSNQLHALRFDAASGKLSMIGLVAEGLRPTWSVAHPQLPILYAVNDIRANEGTVIAYAVDRASGKLSKVNDVTTGGKGSTYIWLDLPSLTLLVANYGGGSVSSIAVNKDGTLGALVSTIKATGSGPDRRQAEAHAHSVAVDPSGRYALVSDLGADRMFVYALDRTTHALTPDDAAHPRAFIATPGSGPRHFVFGANGNFVYLFNEMSAEITTLRWDAQKGRLTLVQSLQTSRPEFVGTKSGSEIAVSNDGRYVYAANRGENTLVVYRVNPESGELALVGRAPSGGDGPWSFAMHASGKWMLVVHQRSGKVNVLSVDPVSGMAADSGQAVEITTPVSVTFVK